MTSGVDGADGADVPAPDDPATLRTDVELPGVPGLGGLYARGVAASARLAALSRLGRASDRLPGVAYVVRGVRADPDRLTAYQHLLGEPASDALPAGYVHVLAFPVATALMVRDDFPLPLAGMVHLANRVQQHRAPVLGEPLDVRAHAQDLRRHRSGAQVDLVTEVRSGGDVVWRGVSTYLAKGVRLPAGRSGAETPDAGSGGGRRGGRPEFVPPVPTGQWSLGADAGRRYAAVSGDRNPIHLSRVTARAMGFPRAIAHGMLTASRALADVGRARGDAFAWTVEFAKPVLLPARVTVRVAPDLAGGGYAYTGWDGRCGALHLHGTVVPR
ncbi:MaoC/PaaZ C-terminal domain-containing protein [Cellulomonas aerilata]|uniref:Acyl dehydratase n=1 Tax=Cellulomonas aerilata TaxID=515326 RepID=A0A512DF21_9CELL|nr:MaoC/PaaZ C-terminal domain-containing protein [Cellulomonas aerilata]GEO35084.1 acyl dehydratase [Cellulomonas aerilata]